MRILLIICASLLMLISGASSKQFGDEGLVQQLLKNLQPVGKFSRPVADPNDNVTVSLGLSLIRIKSVEHGSAELDVWLDMNWKDPRLEWKPTEHSGISSVALPADLMWLPDIRPYSVLGYQPDKETCSQVVVSSSGDVAYILPARIRFACHSLRNDSVTCVQKLGSWVFNGQQLSLQLKDGPQINVEVLWSDKFEVVSAYGVVHVQQYSCCPEPYFGVSYTVTLKPKDKKSKNKKSKKH